MTRDDSGQTATTHADEDTDDRPAPASPRFATLILLSALAVLPVNMIVPSLPDIAASFRADPALTALAVTAYAFVTATVEIFAGALSDRYGRRRVVLSALAVFIAASVGCMFAANIGMFLLFRAAQASIDACFCVALVIIRETYGARGAASRLGYLAMGWAVAPMVGPVVGGLLGEHFGWRASFVVLAFLGAAALAGSMREIRDRAPPAPRSGSSHFTVYSRLLRSGRFWAYAGCMSFSMGTFYIFLGGAPLIAARLLDLSGSALGLYIGMVPTGFVVGSYLAGRYASRVRPGTALISARLLTCLGLACGLVLSLAGVVHALALFGPCILIGIGNGLTMPAANAGILASRTDFAGTAVGLAAAIRIGGGALIASAGGLLLGHSGTIGALFGLMLISASLALLAAICAALSDRRTAV